MKALRAVLIIVGLIILIPCSIGVFLSWEKLTGVWELFGVEVPSETEGSLTVYVSRALFMTMAWAGALFLLSAGDVKKYVVLIRVLALAGVCVGLTCIVVGVNISIPAVAYLGDGLFCLIAGGLIWTLSSPLGCQSEEAKSCCN